MKKVNLERLYENPLPPTDTSVLWVDRDEITDDIRAIHKYNKKSQEWQPWLVNVSFMEPEEELLN